MATISTSDTDCQRLPDELIHEILRLASINSVPSQAQVRLYPTPHPYNGILMDDVCIADVYPFDFLLIDKSCHRHMQNVILKRVFDRQVFFDFRGPFGPRSGIPKLRKFSEFLNNMPHLHAPNPEFYINVDSNQSGIIEWAASQLDCDAKLIGQSYIEGAPLSRDRTIQWDDEDSYPAGMMSGHYETLTKVVHWARGRPRLHKGCLFPAVYVAEFLRRAFANMKEDRPLKIPDNFVGEVRRVERLWKIRTHREQKRCYWCCHGQQLLEEGLGLRLEGELRPDDD